MVSFLEIPDYGTKMTIKQFKKACESNFLKDYDGFGCYSFKNKMSDVTVYPSDIKNKKIQTKFSHVVWFNR